MHYHYTKYFSFDAITEEQEEYLYGINAQYGGDAVAVGDVAFGGRFLAICTMNKELLVLLKQEVENLRLPGLRHELLFDRENECDDEACVTPKAGEDTQKIN
jgi:hypothetical protein